MIYVWGRAAPVARHSTLKSAVDEAERLRPLTDHSIYILKPEHCLEGVEPPKSAKKKAKDKKYFQKAGIAAIVRAATLDKQVE